LQGTSEPTRADDGKAKDAPMGAIRDPVTLFFYQQHGMLTMPAIQALYQNIETERLYGLLTIFQEEKLEGYHEFVKKHGLLNDLSAENCIHHLRILSPCSLAAEHEEIPYATVVQTL
jgi:hypothetical protein